MSNREKSYRHKLWDRIKHDVLFGPTLAEYQYHTDNELVNAGFAFPNMVRNAAKWCAQQCNKADKVRFTDIGGGTRIGEPLDIRP